MALIHLVSQQVYNITTQQLPFLGTVLPIQGDVVFANLVKIMSDFTDYLEKEENKNGNEELLLILGRFAEIAYVVQGNGSYLYEKGILKL